MNRASKLLAATALVAVGFAGEAFAVPYASSFNANPSGSLSDVGGSTIPTATSINVNNGVSAYSIGSFSSGTSIQFGLTYIDLGTVGDTLTFSTASFNIAGGQNTLSVSWSDIATGTHTFTATSELSPGLVTLGQSSFLNLSWVGNIVNSDTVDYPNQTADFTLSFNQTGTGSISSSATFDTPNTLTTVPEPVSMSILGLGLAGLAAARRRRA